MRPGAVGGKVGVKGISFYYGDWLMFRFFGFVITCIITDSNGYYTF